MKFSLTPSSLLSAEGHSGRLLLSASSRRFRRSVSNLRPWLPTVPLDFRCSGDWERLEQLLISWHGECFSQSCHSRLFISSHFLPVYLWFEPVDWHFSLYWENSYLPRVRARAKSRVTNRSEGMFVSASLFLGARDRVAIREIFIVLATSGHPCSWREGMVWESKIA